MIRLEVVHNLQRIKDRVNMIPNDVTEALSRTFTEHSQSLLEELISKFGENLRYANMQTNFSGSEFSIDIFNINEYALRDGTGASLDDVSQHAIEYIKNKFIESLQKDSFYGGQL